MAAPTRFGVTTDYEYSATHSRDRLEVWSGPFFSVWEATGLSLPRGGGFMLTTYNDDKIRVTCPARRTSANYEEVDAAISAALNAHYAKRSVVQGTYPLFGDGLSVTHWTCPKAPSAGMTHHLAGSANKCAYCHRDALDLRTEQAEIREGGIR